MAGVWSVYFYSVWIIFKQGLKEEDSLGLKGDIAVVGFMLECWVPDGLAG